MEISDIQFVDGKVEITFMGYNTEDIMTIRITLADLKLLKDYENKL